MENVKTLKISSDKVLVPDKLLTAEFTLADGSPVSKIAGKFQSLELYIDYKDSKCILHRWLVDDQGLTLHHTDDELPPDYELDELVLTLRIKGAVVKTLRPR